MKPQSGTLRRWVVSALTVSLLLVGCRGIDFPNRVVEPVQIGVVSDIVDEPGANVVVFGPHRLRLSTDESHPGVNIDSLMLYWGDAEPPFMTLLISDGFRGPRPCYSVRGIPSAAFNEPDAIVMVMRENYELGIRVPKAEEYEADPLEYDEDTGAFTLPAPDFCLNDAGEVVAGGGTDD